jgi:hypothetical protein
MTGSSYDDFQRAEDLLRAGKLDAWEREVTERWPADQCALWFESNAKGTPRLNDWFAWNAAARARVRQKQYIPAISAAYNGIHALRSEGESISARQNGDRSMSLLIAVCMSGIRKGLADAELEEYLGDAAYKATPKEQELLASIREDLAAENNPEASAAPANEREEEPRKCPTCTEDPSSQGYLTCAMCGGKSTILVGTSGYGLCGMCKGMGKIMCRTCRGTGWVS